MTKFIRSTFQAEFDLKRLKDLISKIYDNPLQIEEINCQISIISFLKRIKIEGSENCILVLELEGELRWNFKLREIVACYLKEEQVEVALVVLTTTREDNWCWGLVKREELSPYLLTCYTIPVGQELNEIELKKIKDSLTSNNLREIINDFKTELTTDFIEMAKNHYYLIQDNLKDLLIYESETNIALKSEKIAQKLILKTIIFYLLKEGGLIEINFREKNKAVIDSLQEVAQLEVLGLLKEQQQVYFPTKCTLLKKFFLKLEKYNWSIVEDQPWDQKLALSPAILADLNEGLLTSNQRKTSGVFYTPAEIVHYMSQQTIIDFLADQVKDISYEQIEMLIKERDLADINKRGLADIYNFLTGIKICDPAVGSGAFALGMAKELIRIKEIILSLIDDQVALSQLKTATVKESIYCMDIDQTAITITKLRLWLWTEKNDPNILLDLGYKAVQTNPLLKIERNLTQQDEELKAIRDNDYKTDSLTDRYQGRLNFKHLKEDKLGLVFSFVDYFPEVFKLGGFDIVIGNPPYIGEKGNKDTFREIKKYALRDFYSGKMDIFYFFFHLGLDIIKKQGIIALITTDYYLTATGAYKLRTDLQKRGIIKKLIDFNNLRLFPAALGQHNLITIVKKKEDKDQSSLAQTTITYREGDAAKETLLSILAGEDQQSNYYSIPQQSLYQGEENYLRLEVGQVDELLSKVKIQGQKLGELCHVKQGIVSGCDRVSPQHISKYDLPKNLKGAGIFVLSQEEVAELNLQEKDEDLLRPWFKNSDIKQYWCRSENKGEYLLYLDQNLKSLPPEIKDYFKQFKDVLKNRREVQANRLLWWQLQWARQEEMFLGPKIIVPQRSKNNTFAYNEEPWYASADVYYITDAAKNINLKYILALLNSKLYYLWFYYRGKKKGELLELYQRPLTRVPIKVVSEDEEQVFVDLVENLEKTKGKLVEYQQIDFLDIKDEFKLTEGYQLEEIIEGNNNFQIHYQGQASIVRELTVKIDSDLVVVYSAKSSSGNYKLFEFKLSDKKLRLYLKYYLENLSTKQLEEVNQRDISSVVKKVLKIVIPGYYDEQIQALLDRWHKIRQEVTRLKTKSIDLQKEIDYLVYKLYNFTDDEIEFLTKKVSEIKDY